MPWWFEFVLLYGLYKFYSYVRNGVSWEARTTAYDTAADILRIEDALHLAWERRLNDWTAGLGRPLRGDRAALRVASTST